ncbi:MAG TPA: hypothetical protein VNK49_14070 [Anaerolineales bacterium]|nr:hypothetical protein [Anaerolineales bacterium]
MSQPASNPNENEPSKLKRLLSGSMDETIRSRLPRLDVSRPKGTSSVQKPSPSRSTPGVTTPRLKFLPAFWTVASVLSMIVNVILIAILLIALRMLGTIQVTANDTFSGVLGGLYINFVKMDQATIRADVPVEANVPLDITVPVQTTTTITLASDTVIPNAHVRIATGTLNIDADATVTLPANTPLSVNLNFPLQVVNTIPVRLNVPVNIPLNQTELHEPFVGLQKVIEPFYCLVEPNAEINGVNICSPISNLQLPGGTNVP